MSKKLYVGNLAYSVDDHSLGNMFSQAGTVDSAKVIMDRETGRSKGFGFVEMASEDEANNAINQLNGKDLAGRPVRVSLARPQEPREGGGGRMGGGGGFRNRGNGGGGGGHRGDYGGRGGW